MRTAIIAAAVAIGSFAVTTAVVAHDDGHTSREHMHPLNGAVLTEVTTYETGTHCVLVRESGHRARALAIACDFNDE